MSKPGAVPRSTPGPWTLLEDRISAPCHEHVECEKTIAWLGRTPDQPLRCSIGPNDEANARLIAAAPDLLEALKLAQRWLANCVPTVELDGPKPLPVIADALAKAEGRSDG